MIWEQVEGLAGAGNVVMSWSATNESGFDFVTHGPNRRHPINVDGLRLVQFGPDAIELPQGTVLIDENR